MILQIYSEARLGGTRQQGELYGVQYAKSGDFGIRAVQLLRKMFTGHLAVHLNRFRYYPAIMRTTTMDPLCEKYYDISPYAWCGNNTVGYVDLTGMDWYSVQHEADDEHETAWEEYIYNDNIYSQKDLDRLHINGKYIGMTAEKDNIYYSLFGNVLQKNTDEGQLYVAIDNALIKLAKYQKEAKNYNPYSSEDIQSPRTEFNVKRLVPGQSIEIQYEGGFGIYRKTENNKAYNEIFPDIKRAPIDYGGWQKSKPSYPLVFRNNGNWDIVIVKFYEYETAKKFVENYNRQFFNK